MRTLKNNAIVRAAVIAVLPVFLGVVAAQQSPLVENGQFTGQDNLVHPFSVTRLAPAAFANLPGAVRDALVQKGCTVPQPSGATGAESVISGKFRDGSSGDWAVLCSKGGSSSVLVFWNGSAQAVDELASEKDTDYLQAPRSGVVYVYSRRISAASPERIRKPKQNRRLEPFEHDGIDDAFVGNGSVIHYYRQRQWEELQGGEVKR
jgi:hypothetical protein